MIASLLDIYASFSFIDAHYYWAGYLCPTEFVYGMNKCRKASNPLIRVDISFTYSCILPWVPLNEVSFFVNTGIDQHWPWCHSGKVTNELREPMWSRFMLLINSENNSIITLWQNSFRHPFFSRCWSLLSSTLKGQAKPAVIGINSSFQMWFLTNVRQRSFFAFTRQANSQCNFPDQAILVVYEKNVNFNILVHRQLLYFWIILPVE